MFEHLLVAVDGSKHSRRAIEAASVLALKLGSRLTILHVIAHAGDNRIPDDLKEFARVEHIQTDEAVILETVGNAIVDRAKQEAISKGVEAVETALLRGDAATEIIQFAAENDVVYICTTHDFTLMSAKRMFLGRDLDYDDREPFLGGLGLTVDGSEVEVFIGSANRAISIRR